MEVENKVEQEVEKGTKMFSKLRGSLEQRSMSDPVVKIPQFAFGRIQKGQKVPQRDSDEMKFLILLHIFLAAEAARKKRGRLKGGTKVQSATKYPSYVALVKASGWHFC